MKVFIQLQTTQNLGYLMQEDMDDIRFGHVCVAKVLLGVKKHFEERQRKVKRTEIWRKVVWVFCFGCRDGQKRGISKK